VRTDFGPIVKAVIEAPETAINLFAVGEYMTWTSYLKSWCESQGVKFGGVDEGTYEDFVRLMPGGLGHEFACNVLFATEFGYEGGDKNIVRPDHYGLRMTTWKEYCAKTDFSAIL